MNAPIIMKAESLPRRHPRERPDGSLTHCHPASQPARLLLDPSLQRPADLPLSLLRSLLTPRGGVRHEALLARAYVSQTVGGPASERAAGRPNSLH